jgi:hypothetical protein
MSWVLSTLFTHDITVEPYSGTDEYGNDTFGPPVVYKGRQEERNEESAEDDRSTLLQRATVYFYGNPPVKLNDRITLLDGPQFPILQLFKQRGPGSSVEYISCIVGRRAGE